METWKKKRKKNELICSELKKITIFKKTFSKTVFCNFRVPEKKILGMTLTVEFSANFSPRGHEVVVVVVVVGNMY